MMFPFKACEISLSEFFPRDKVVTSQTENISHTLKKAIIPEIAIHIYTHVTSDALKVTVLVIQSNFSSNI